MDRNIGIPVYRCNNPKCDMQLSLREFRRFTPGTLNCCPKCGSKWNVGRIYEYKAEKK